MTSVCRLVLNAWLIFQSTGAVTVTEFRPENCPSPCLCGVGTSLSPMPVKGYFNTVSCSNRKLPVYPASLPSETQILVLRGNALESALTEGATLPAELSELDLSYNIIADVTVTSPSHLLLYVNLGHNVIQSLSASSFADLRQLQVLLLDYNRITHIDPDCLRPLAQLRWLSLAGNHLSTLTAEAFGNLLPQLSHLDLSRNQIENVADNALYGLSSLKVLHLSYNRISQLSGISFAGLEGLERLDLSGNRLLDVPTEAMKIFKRLETLTLDTNPLSSLLPRRISGFSARFISVSRMPNLRFVDAEAFFDVEGLTTIALHNNAKLAFVSEYLVGPYTTAKSIVNVQLHNCLLTTLSNLNNTLPALQLLTLYENPLHCNCHNDWIHEMVLSNKSRIRLSLTVDSNATADYNLLCTNESQAPSRNSTTSKPELSVFRYRQSVISSTTVSSRFAEIATNDSDRTLANGTNRHFVSFAYRSETLGDIATTGSSATPEMENTTATSSSCGGAAILLSDDVIYSALGSSRSLNCRAVGVTSIYWVLPGHKIVRKTPNHSRLRLSEAGSLVIDHVKSLDAGRYSCRATSGSLDDVSDTTARLFVYNARAKLVVRRVGSDFVSVTWKGLDTTISTTQYAVLYRQRDEYQPTSSSTFASRCGSGTSEECPSSLDPATASWLQPRDLCTGATGSSYPSACYRRVNLRQYMRSYWIGGLKAEQTYEFCIGYVRQTDDWLVSLDCYRVTTRQLSRRYDAGQRVSMLVSIFVVVLITAPCILCLITASVKRYRHRKQYSEPTSGSSVRRTVDVNLEPDGSSGRSRADDGAAVRSTDLFWRRHPEERTTLRRDCDITPIPLDCLYDLPSTALSATTSQTSLITHA